MTMMVERLVRPDALLRLEGAAIFATAVLCYRHLGASWVLFAVLLLFPDLGALGYLAGERLGLACYNSTHTLIAPASLALLGLLTGGSLVLALAAIWLAHIGMDRLVGYGLKAAVPTEAAAPRPDAFGLPVTH
ncbi:MAG TPA: DUF4260 family protein [Thermomicrobiales bacterium]